ncbi:uncharacterized protein LOC117801490 isoform X2 [Ailuropoda melanoleuca]|uniref:uncharacterized protein LOC117801490 isoform X2 n=1 Tax=Ailuropoda melanoleuca TaxID=9646 RepID=UPI001494A63E|nr:uncharacterized protein LOC117801490 isoform X2 [Ailuropoda melanoleuca]
MRGEKDVTAQAVVTGRNNVWGFCFLCKTIPAAVWRRVSARTETWRPARRLLPAFQNSCFLLWIVLCLLGSTVLPRYRHSKLQDHLGFLLWASLCKLSLSGELSIFQSRLNFSCGVLKLLHSLMLSKKHIGGLHVSSEILVKANTEGDPGLEDGEEITQKKGLQGCPWQTELYCLSDKLTSLVYRPLFLIPQCSLKSILCPAFSVSIKWEWHNGVNKELIFLGIYFSGLFCHVLLHSSRDHAFN